MSEQISLNFPLSFRQLSPIQLVGVISLAWFKELAILNIELEQVSMMQISDLAISSLSIRLEALLHRTIL